jgi:hypothetical protein
MDSHHRKSEMVTGLQRSLQRVLQGKEMLMAVMKIWPIKGRLDHPLNYIKNPEKTRNLNGSGNEKEEKMIRDAIHSLEGVVDYAIDESKTVMGEFVTGVNCNPDSAKEEFVEVKKYYGKEDKIIAYHAYQSFKP